MNVETISMPPDVALAKLGAYERQLKKQASAEVKAEWSKVRDAYAALAKGTPVIDLHASIREAGVDEKQRPKLAVCRADGRQVFAETSGSDLRFTIRQSMPWGRALTNATRASIVVTTPQPKGLRGYFRGRAVVPMIPADVLPTTGRTTFSRHLILWEADWDAIPVDPMLLRPLGGSLFAVVAQWDLTEVERMVLRGRL